MAPSPQGYENKHYKENAKNLLILLSGAAFGAAIPLVTKYAFSAAGWTVRNIDEHYSKAEDRGWVRYFEEAASKYNFTVEQLMAIGSRETNMENIKGDYVGGVAQGYGIMQIDIKSYPEFIKSGDWSDPRKNILKGAEVLSDKKQFIVDHVGHKRTVGKGKRQKTYVGLSLTTAGLLRTATAAYNCGEWAYCAISTIGDPDKYTTGANYSTDVMNRSEVFARMIGRPLGPTDPNS